MALSVMTLHPLRVREASPPQEEASAATPSLPTAQELTFTVSKFEQFFASDINDFEVIAC